MPDNDPWFWTVDEVVAQLCRSSALFLTAGQSATDIPDRPALEIELRMRNITGEALLKLNTFVLIAKNELKISHVKQRLALLVVIGTLQRRSHAYKQFQASAGAEPIDSVQGPRNGAQVSPATQRQKRIEPVRQAPQMQMQRLPGEPDEFDYLLRWQDTAEDDDEIIDFAADDDLEDDEHADWAEDDMDVLNSDENEELPTRCRLSGKEIYDIIDERINFYIDSWTPNAGAIPGEEVEYDVNAMWDKAEASGQRQILVQKYGADYAYFKHRLDKMREEIKSFPGSNATQIRQQCRNLEGTIESMELAGWLRDIYKLEPVADGDEELVNGGDGLANYSNERANFCDSVLDYSDDPANYSDGLVDYSDDAVHDATPPKSHVVADTEIIDLHLLREPVRKSTLNADKSTQDAAYLFGIPRKHQAQIPPPKSRIAHTIEPMVDRHHESQNSTRSLNHGDEPEKASFRSVRRWKWHELIEHLDRKRIVSKAIFEMNVSDREAVRTRVCLIKKSNLLREIAAYINMLKRGKSELPCILPQDMRKITNFTNLFLSWWFCKNYFKEPNASIGDLEELQSCIEDGSAGTTTFYDYVCTIMNTTFSEEALQHPEQPSQAEIIEISDDD